MRIAIAMITMGLIELSEKFLQKVKEAFNSILKDEGKEIRITTEAEELPSPQARLSKNEDFLDALDELLEKYYIDVKIVGVTDTNSMDGWIDYGHQVVLISFKNEEEKAKIQVGDIIWFHRMSDGSPNVLHRVIEKHDGWVVTRGDNLVENDGPTINASIKGYLAMIIY